MHCLLNCPGSPYFKDKASARANLKDIADVAYLRNLVKTMVLDVLMRPRF